jgi:hypothetical protein
MPKKSYPLAKVYGLLEPGPVVLLTTAAGAGECDDDVVACDAGIRAAAAELRCQQPQLLFDLLMATRECDQYSDRRDCGTSRAMR